MASDRRWWLQLQFAFFQDKRVRALRRKHGDLAMIIYQKMMLKSLEENCTMKFEGLEDTFEEEIAVDIVEDEPEKVLLIKQVVGFLVKHELMIEQEDGCFFFPQAAKMSGSESSSAERVRRHREKKKALQCNGDVLQDDNTSNDDVSHCNVTRTEQETETNLHLNSDKSKSLDVKSKTETKQADPVPADQLAASAAADAEPPAGDLFSVEQLLAKVKKNKVDLTEEGVRAFYDEMHESGWILYQKPVEKRMIVRAMRGWAKNNPEYGIETDKTQEDDIEPWPDRCKEYFKEWLAWNGYDSTYIKGASGYEEIFIDEALIQNVVWRTEDTHELFTDIQDRAKKMGVGRIEFEPIILLYDTDCRQSTIFMTVSLI